MLICFSPGLWCLLCGGLSLLYSQTMTAVTHISAAVIKLALLLSLLGVGVMILDPHLSFTLSSVFQWIEIFSAFSLAILVSCQPPLPPSSLVLAAAVFSTCPGARACLYLWPSFTLFTAAMCVLDAAALLTIFFLCLLPIEWTQATERIMNARFVF